MLHRVITSIKKTKNHPLNKAILQERLDQRLPSLETLSKQKKKPSLAIRGDVPRKIPSEIFSSRPHPRKKTQKRGRSRARDLHAREINHKANNAAAKRETRIPGKRRGGARSLKLIHYTKHPPSFPRPFPRKCSLMGNYNGSREREREESIVFITNLAFLEKKKKMVVVNGEAW